MTDIWQEQLALLPDYLSAHLVLSCMALAAGVAVSLPLAIAVLRVRRLRSPVMTAASVIQTIPGLALLALMVPLLGRIGFLPAVCALILYSMLPVLRNTVTGIEQVDGAYIEAGRGLGMTPNQLLFRVQLPLALPVIVAGIRTAAVWVVGMATLSTPVGATSLGNFIFSGLQTQNYAAVITGCVAAAGLAVILDRVIRLIEIAVARRRLPIAVGAVALLLAGSAAGFWPVLSSVLVADDRPRVVLATKTFTEQYILGQLIARELESAGYAPELTEGLGSTVAFDALAAERIDAYVDYTGTIWANYMNRTANPGRAAIQQEVETWLAEQHDIEIAATLGFENSYALAMQRARAETLGIETIEDLVRYAPEMTIGGDYEFFGRPEWVGLVERYGLDFDAMRTMDSTLMYAAVVSGEVDVISAFSTDGRIPAFDLTLIADPRNALPPYDAVLLLAPGIDARAPELRQVLSALEQSISADAMRLANKLVDLDGGSVTEAAAMLAREIHQ